MRNFIYKYIENLIVTIGYLVGIFICGTAFVYPFAVDDGQWPAWVGFIIYPALILLITIAKEFKS